MEKKNRLRDFVPLEQAAEYMSHKLGEKFFQSDLLRLAFDRKLILSVRAWSGMYVCNASKQTIPRDKVVRFVLDRLDPDCAMHFVSDGEATLTTDVWDLAMRGGELDILCYACEQCMGRLEESAFDGILLSDGLGRLVIPCDDAMPTKDGYISTGNLLAFTGQHELGVRFSELSRLISLADEKDQSISPKREGALLNIIFVLMDFVISRRKITINSQAALIDAMVMEYSDKVGISKSNLENIFAAAKRSNERK